MGRFALPPGQRIQKFTTDEDRIEFTPGKTKKLKLTKNDYLTRLLLVSDMEVVSGAVAPTGLSGMGAFAPLGTIEVTGTGKRTLISMPAYYQQVYNRIRRQRFRGYGTSDVVAPNSTTSWRNGLIVDLTIDDLTDKGAVYLGDQQLTVELALSMPTIADIWTTPNGATITGGWDVYRVDYNLPVPDAADPRSAQWLDNISYFRQLRHFTTVDLNTSEQRVQLPTEEDYCRILLFFYTGSADDATYTPSDGLFDHVRLAVNDKVDLIKKLTEGVFKAQAEEDYPIDPLPAGVNVIDYLREWNSKRDVLPTDAGMARTVDLFIEGNGTANSHCDIVLETVVDSPWAEKFLRNVAARNAASRTPGPSTAAA